MIRATLVLAAALILAAFLNSGIYGMVAAGAGGGVRSGEVIGYRFNRFTGSVTYCVENQCINAVSR